MKRLLSLAVAVLLMCCCAWPVAAKKNRYDRGIKMSTFVPKGQWLVGATFSYSEEENTNFEYLSILKDIEGEGYSFKVSPLVRYFVADNICIGGRFAFSRSNTDLGNLSVELGDDLSFELEDYKAVSNTYTASLFFRNYINLGDSKRFAVFNELRTAYSYSESTSEEGTGKDYTGLYQLKHNLNIGVSPGIVCFINDFTAVEASVNVAGLNFNWYDQTKDKVYEGKRTASSANFKINLLSIDLGVVFCL